MKTEEYYQVFFREKFVTKFFFPLTKKFFSIESAKQELEKEKNRLKKYDMDFRIYHIQTTYEEVK